MRRLFFFTFLISTLSFGQVQDAEFWAGIAIKADVTKKLSLKYETQTRFFKNASTLKTYYNELNADYEVFDDFELGLGYRYSKRNRGANFAGDNRISLNSSYDFNLAETGLKFKTRARYQYSFERFGVINDFIYPDIDHLFRWKFELEYENDAFKRIIPFAGYELFKAIQPAGYNGLDGYRVYAGFELDLPNRHAFEFKYIFEYEVGDQPQAIHNYMVQYNYELSSKLFKKKKKD